MVQYPQIIPRSTFSFCKIMSSQTITLKLPESLYRSARQMARVTHRPMEEVLQESIERILPPLDDVPPEDAKTLAALSMLDDSELWREARAELPIDQQKELDSLLERQGAGELTPQEAKRLQALMDEYGRLTVHKAHAWLLLARRGYQVPPQS